MFGDFVCWWLGQEIRRLYARSLLRASGVPFVQLGQWQIFSTERGTSKIVSLVLCSSTKRSLELVESMALNPFGSVGCLNMFNCLICFSTSLAWFTNEFKPGVSDEVFQRQSALYIRAAALELASEPALWPSNLADTFMSAPTSKTHLELSLIHI